MVGSKENSKFDVGVKGLIIYNPQTCGIVLENVAEILVVLLIYCWFNYLVQLGLYSASTES